MYSQGVHDGGNAGLVIRAQQRGAVGGDQRLALVFQQGGEFSWVKAPCPLCL